MHMADALISPAVGGTLWIVAGGLMAACARRIHRAARDNLAPMMGVLGAFVFAAQMINFTIPGTGSSGHLGGGLLLTVLLGPCAALLTIASVLTVQALFFADGGLLALGCNIVNLGLFPAFVAFPLIYRPLAGGAHGTPRAWTAAVAAAMSGMLLGAFGVVIETRASGISDLPFIPFALLMFPIHLAIGAVEGLATAAVVTLVARSRPETLSAPQPPGTTGAIRGRLIGLALAAAVIGGGVSWFASTRPDGLEWSIARLAGAASPAAPDHALHHRLSAWQERMAWLPDYGFRTAGDEPGAGDDATDAGAAWPSMSMGTSVAGLLGGTLTLGLACLAGWAIRMRAPAGRPPRTGESAPR